MKIRLQDKTNEQAKQDYSFRKKQRDLLGGNMSIPHINLMTPKVASGGRPRSVEPESYFWKLS